MFQFPAYVTITIVLPLIHGCWRFATSHALSGPPLAEYLTSDPSEMPAIWCLFSLETILIGASPPFREILFGTHRPLPA